MTLSCTYLPCLKHWVCRILTCGDRKKSHGSFKLDADSSFHCDKMEEPRSVLEPHELYVENLQASCLQLINVP